MDGRNLEVALRIKADLAEAGRNVDGFNQKMGETGKQVDAAGNALGRSSARFDALQASTARMVELLANMDARMATMASGSQRAAEATQAVAATTSAVVTSVRELAESEADATARIRAMVAASLEQQTAEQAVAAAANEAAAATHQRAAAAEDVAATVQRQTAQMRQSSAAAAEAAAAERKAAGGAQDHAAELGRLLSQIDPTIAALERLDQQEQQLARFRDMGMLDAESFQRFQSQIDTSRASLGRMGVSAGQTAQAMRMLPAQITDVTVSLAAGMPIWLVAIQQGGQIKDSFGGIGPAISGVLSLLTPLRVAVGGVVGVLALLTVAAVAGYRENERLASSIILTGNYAGTTTGQIDQLASSLGAVNGRSGTARDILNGLVGSGRIAGDALESVGRAAVNMAALSGKSAQDVVAEWTKVADDPVRAALELDKQYHFLDTTVFQHIQTLQQAGNQYEALKVVASAFADDTAAKMDELHKRMGWLEKFADNWGRGVDNIKARLLDIGAPATEIDKFQEALAKYNETYKAYQDSLGTGSTKGYSDQLFAQAKQAYQDLQAAQAAALKVQSDAAAKGVSQQVQSDGKAAAASIDQLTNSLDRAKQRQQELNKAASDLYKIHLAGGQLPAGINFDGPTADMPQGAGWDKLKAEIEKRYADPKAPKAKSDSAALAAQQQLIKMLNDEQGALDPTAKAWAVYNDKLQEANGLAAKAVTARGADVTAIRAQRDAVVGLAAQVRDAALAKEADKDRDAFEQLRAGLTKLDETKLEKVTLQIKQLRGYLSRDTINQGEFDQTAGDIVQNSLVKLPSYKGIAGAVGGPSGESAKIDTQQAALESAYKTDLDLLNQYHEQKLISDQEFIDQENKLYTDHAQELQRLDEARRQLALTTAVQGFESLAAATRDAFGEQSGAYRAAFALAKGAAVAQATLNVVKAISNAGADVPYPGNIFAMVQIGAQMAALVGQLVSVNAGFSGGGYTGDGGKYQIAGYVHAGEGVLNQEDIAALGGPAAFERFRRGLRGYAEGGFVHPLADAPRFAAPSSPQLQLPAPQEGSGKAQSNNLRLYNLFDMDTLAERLAIHPVFEKRIVVVAGENGTAIRANW